MLEFSHLPGFIEKVFLPIFNCYVLRDLLGIYKYVLNPASGNIFSYVTIGKLFNLKEIYFLMQIDIIILFPELHY